MTSEEHENHSLPGAVPCGVPVEGWVDGVYIPPTEPPAWWGGQGVAEPDEADEKCCDDWRWVRTSDGRLVHKRPGPK